MLYDIFCWVIGFAGVHSDQWCGLRSKILNLLIPQITKRHHGSTLSVAIGLFFLGTQAFGTTYYISSTSGSDSNTGTSTSSPWKTIKKVNSRTYKPGDSILFKAGDTWKGSPNFSVTLTTPSAGSSGYPITYGTYGSGAAPILDGGGALGTVMNISKNYIAVNGLQLQNATSHLISFANTTGTKIVNVTGYNAGLWAFYGGSGGASTGATTIDHTTYKQLSSSFRTSIAFLIEGSSQTAPIVVTNNVCDERAVSNSGAMCIDVNGLGNATIQYNQVYGGGQGISLKPRGGTNCLGPSQTGGLIADNYIWGINRNAGAVDGEGAELTGCPGYPQSNVILARNIFICVANSSDAFGSYVSSNAVAYGNIVIGPCGSGSGSSTPRMAAWNAASPGESLFNNTFVGDGTVSNLAGVLYSPQATGVVKNNIFKHLAVGVSAAGPVTEDYNIFDSDVTSPRHGTVTSGGHSHTKTSPQFVSSTIAGPNDVKLLDASPAIHAGANLGAAYKLILNPIGTAVPFGTFDESPGWLIGAFGYLAPTAAPSFNPLPGTYQGTQSVSLADTSAGALIYYTTDGSTPTTSSTLYTTPITVNSTTTIKAMAMAPGFRTSSVVSASYTIN